MVTPLLPKATAVWLIDNTSLSFEQIAAFCGLHTLEVQGIADGEVAVGIVGLDPLANGQLTQEEIDRCQADPSGRLKISKPTADVPQPRRRGGRYTPVSRRGDRPDAISWLLKFHPELTDAQISKLVGTTKTTINSVRERSHWNAQNIRPRDPVSLGICT
ncbi:MAG: cytoplasmic protein [Sneathiella sp.]|nr:cell cycle transcriptional regulator TrcR [Sneathiella sp.]MAL80401.1 cytoplasmic protein [Sneathiella sp.]